MEEPLYFYVQRDNSLVNKQTFKTGQIFNIFNDVFLIIIKRIIYLMSIRMRLNIRIQEFYFVAH